eukprot:GHVR01164918.1.p1 GENE.GHVR01164918.1~~GHVR01164918.1.p1  ORF type:complete len:123 (+),score=36.54 GHVR01164918.1:54-422(+)
MVDLRGRKRLNISDDRLIIDKIILENFKSYGGVVEIGRFHRCYTAIMGANGSGKSNVIDALLFVFGKRAKQLRLDRLSELVHNSCSITDCTHCKVSVHFRRIIDNPVHIHTHMHTHTCTHKL